jgi:hypothetical protein
MPSPLRAEIENLTPAMRNGGFAGFRRICSRLHE